jgi:trehalose 6-phosphate synthase/phosphatase
MPLPFLMALSSLTYLARVVMCSHRREGPRRWSAAMGLVLVSNRLPVTATYERGRLQLERSSGGLAAGLIGPHEEGDGKWVGWPGDLPRLSKAQRKELETQLAKRRVEPVYLSRADVKGFYEEVANGVLWPVFHYRIDQLEMYPQGWPAFVKVSEAFARATAAAYKPGDAVWIHDYHLVLVPGYVRRSLLDAPIGFFLHIPFPAPAVFRVIPWRREILEGMLGADVVGFHTQSDVDHFIAACGEVLHAETAAGVVTFGGRRTRVAAFPLGIDTQFWQEISQRRDVIERADEIRQGMNGRKLLLGIDRLDYTKGLRHRLTALEILFERSPETAQKVCLIQVVFPSREGIESYAAFKRRVDEMVGRINGRFSTTSEAPIRVLSRNLTPEEVSALYQAADVMLVTPVRDGMNLVAKEFVANRTKEDGVLILSEFAGAADELSEAVIVNPYHVEELADGMKQALEMPLREQRQRMRALRQRVLKSDVHAWVESFLAALQPDRDVGARTA